MAARADTIPTFFHTARPVPLQEAQQLLAAFLEHTSSNAYLHPDAILSQTGIQFSAQSGPQGGLALHNLRRIEAGLRGENLTAESSEELKALFSLDDTQDELDHKRQSAATEDAEEYAQAQDEVLEEIGNETLAGNGEQVEVPEISTSKSGADKAFRKAAKKAKRMAEKQKKHERGTE